MRKLAIIIALFFAGAANAVSITVPMNLATEKGVGASIGEIVITESKYGLMFAPHLHGLPAGLHGFHIHENESCEPKEKDGKMMPALGAGGHYDPEHTGKHLGPYSDSGHLGDLPPLYANSKGDSDNPVLAPRLKSLKEIEGRALMIHIGGDNYSDHPNALGGGGGRLGCGVIK